MPAFGFESDIRYKTHNMRTVYVFTKHKEDKNRIQKSHIHFYHNGQEIKVLNSVNKASKGEEHYFVFFI